MLKKSLCTILAIALSLFLANSGELTNALKNPPSSSLEWDVQSAGSTIHLTFTNANVLMAMFSFSVNGSQNEAVVLFPLQTSHDRQYFNTTGSYHISMSTPSSAACITARVTWDD